MQAIWRGAINFGLISIPVRLFSATEEKAVRFNLLHKADGGRRKANWTCSVCGETLTQDDLIRGYEHQKGEYVEFTDEELANVQASIPTSHTVEVVHFTPTEEIDPIYYLKSYYLAPDELGTKAYALLRKALTESDRVAVAKVAIRDKERLATLRVRDNVLVLETMYWPDEIREARFAEIEKDVPVSEGDMKTARLLIDNLTEDFEPTQHTDVYRETLLEAAQKKVEGKEIVAPAAAEETTTVVDLTEALKRSLEEVKARGKKASGE
ncbi:MAG TPA: Ku protein [Actinomycetota bacterium]|jgi:DNA end-binding protein Ku|nr:Ku protein [Actinomycetota bacterium]